MGAFQAGLILLRMDQYAKAAELNGTDVLVLAALFSFAADDNKEPVAFPSATRIAGRARLDRRTVQRSLDRLEKQVGVINGERRTHRPTRWSLDPHFLKGTGGTESPAGGTAPPVKRQSAATEAAERRQRGGTAPHECTEVGSEAKRRNRTDVQGDSDSHGGSAGAPPAELASAAQADTEDEPPPADPLGLDDAAPIVSVWVIQPDETEAVANHGQR
jgi:hypothetical protein